MSFLLKEYPSGSPLARLALSLLVGLSLANVAWTQQTPPDAPAPAVPSAPAPITPTTPTAPVVQSAPAPAAPAPPVALPAIADGTPVKLTLKTSLNSSDAREKKSVSFVVADDVLDANGKVVIPAGTPAVGRVLMPSLRAGTNIVQGLVNGGVNKTKITCDYVALPDGAHVPLRASQKANLTPEDQSTATVITVDSLSTALSLKLNRHPKPTKQLFTMYVNLTPTADPASIPPPVVAPTPPVVVPTPPTP